MNLKTIFSALFFLFFCQFCLGQEIEDNENWIGIIEGGNAPFLLHRYDRYNKEDVAKARQKLDLLKQASLKTEWEGSYSSFGELSDSKMIWNSEIGFIDYYVYTCAIELRRLNYGRVIDYPTYINLISGKPSEVSAYQYKNSPTKFVKVKWGERRYLIGEDELQTFGELAAGYHGSGLIRKIESNGEKFEVAISIWNSFWVKTEDAQKKVFGIPIFPKEYEKHARKPIESKIISVGKYEKDKATEQPVATYSRRYVTVSAGKHQGVKTDMSFYIPELKERITIVEVMKNTSIAVLTRILDSETRRDLCFKDDEYTDCPSPKAGMKVKTVPEEFLEIE